MDFKKIAEQYPKAFRKHKDWVSRTFQNGLLVNIRDLYDFFDSEGIIIAIQYTNNKDFNAYIESEETYYEIWNKKFRTEAEEQAFIKAFEILEEKLNA